MSVIRWFNENPVRIVSLSICLLSLAIIINGCTDTITTKRLEARIEALEIETEGRGG